MRIIETSMKYQDFFKMLCTLSMGIFLVSCGGGGGDLEINNIVNVAAPTVDGKTSKTLVSLSSVYEVNGECDPLSGSLEYTLDDGSTWYQIETGCVAPGNFSIQINLFRDAVFGVRAVSDLGPTATSSFPIVIERPPSAKLLQLVTASRSSDPLTGLEDQEQNMDFTMSHDITGAPFRDGGDPYNLDFLPIGMVYVED